MANPQDIAAEAYKEAQQGVVQKIADRLKEQRGVLVAAGIISSPPEPNWNTLAQEAIDQRSINGAPLSEFPPVDGKPLEELIPTRTRINEIAKEVSLAVGENTGSLQGATWGQAFGGFMSSISENGFFATLAGLFNMIFGDGKSENALLLKESIAQRTSNDVRSGVEERLTARASELGLSTSEIQEIGASVENGVRQKAGLPVLGGGDQANGPAAMTDPNALTQEQSDMVRTTIRNGLMAELGLKRHNGVTSVDDANPKSAQLGQMAKLLGVPGGEFTEAQRTAIVDSATDAVHNVATSNPPIRKPEAIRDAIQTRLAASASEMGMNNLDETQRSNALRIVANTLTTQYLNSRRNDRDLPSTAQFNAAAEKENAGLTGGLITSQARPAILASLGLEENAAGELANAKGVDNPKIEMLEQAAGHVFSDTERKKLVGVATDTMTHLQQENITDPAKIRAEFRSRMEKNSTAMGFGDMKKENRDRLFDLMANQSTAAYLTAAVNAKAGEDFSASKQAENARLESDLFTGVAGRKISDALRSQDDLLSQAGGANLTDANYKAIGNAAGTVIAKHSNNDHKALMDSPDAHDTLSDEIFASLKRNRAAINAGSVEFSDEALHSISDQIATKYIEQELPDRKPSAEFTAASKARELVVVRQTIDNEKDNIARQATRAINTDMANTVVSTFTDGNPNATIISPDDVLNQAEKMGGGSTMASIANFFGGLVDATRSDTVFMAQRTGKAPNYQQTSRMGEVVADAIAETTKEGGYTTREEYEKAVRQNIIDSMEEKQGYINGVANRPSEATGVGFLGHKVGPSTTWKDIAVMKLDQKEWNLVMDYAPDRKLIEELATKASQKAGERFSDIPPQLRAPAATQTTRVVTPQTPTVPGMGTDMQHV